MEKPEYRKEKYTGEVYCIISEDLMLSVHHAALSSRVLVTHNSISIKNAKDETLTEAISAVKFWSIKGLADMQIEKIQNQLPALT